MHEACSLLASNDSDLLVCHFLHQWFGAEQNQPQYLFLKSDGLMPTFFLNTSLK